MSCEPEAGAFARAVLLEAANYPEPIHQPEYDAQFDEHPSWAGLPHALQRPRDSHGLLVMPHVQTRRLLGAIEQLSRDDVLRYVPRLLPACGRFTERLPT